MVANSLGYFLAERGEDLDRAEELVRIALAAEPENGAYLDSLGWVLYKKGNFQGAFDQLVKAANAIPDDGTILEHLGLTLKALGQKGEALRVLRRAVSVGADAEELAEAIAELEKAQADQ